MNIYDITQSGLNPIALKITFHPLGKPDYDIIFHIINMESDGYLNLYYYDEKTGAVNVIFTDADWFEPMRKEDVVLICGTEVTKYNLEVKHA